MSKADQDRLTAEIERDETWLRGVMEKHPEPRCRCLEYVKLQVRIAVQEQRIQLDPGPLPSAGVIERLKQSVRAELAAEASVATERTSRPPKWWAVRLAGVSVAAAAAVALLVSPMFWNGGELSGGTAQVEAWEDFAAVLSSAPAEQDVELLRIEGELEELEDRLVMPVSRWDVYESQEMDDRIERLLAESVAGLDV